MRFSSASLSALRSDRVFRAIVTAPFENVGYAHTILPPVRLAGKARRWYSHGAVAQCALTGCCATIMRPEIHRHPCLAAKTPRQKQEIYQLNTHHIGREIG